MYTVRNPIDAVASYMDIFGDSADAAARAIRDSLSIAENWKDDRHTMFIDYHRIFTDPAELICRIHEFLGYDYSDSQVEDLVAATSLAAVRRRIHQSGPMRLGRRTTGTGRGC